ncbi:MAG: FAD-binding oxidoreductase [Chloroflexi bacterium AL-W]|nr:FAD-binding oxidoreductase [Chloroflexi bacterium AL-N1]NOK70043.1 FAD-binding oxidoreductase [Chloroflexi bacterium AL-N10]NOK77945.1 FAD-binding oxidoreductase [Chloroflexi bacterium AL-N5]NOK84954.1 FAD-binding oxidoreductase [Chloroflexi bacterium AL-W]NOK91933.1 FAD-binding oxidoreductase [Chloroflexi bacterium AL-N15]
MKRWNGWGYTNVALPVKTAALAFLQKQIGPGRVVPDAALEDVICSVPESRLPDHPLVSTDPLERLLHSTGQSLTDWITMRSGRYDAIVDGVAYPTCVDDVKTLLRFGKQTHIHIIPYGGGTSVVGHLTPLTAEAPVLTVDMSRMRDLLSIDEHSHLATFQAGVLGPDIEAKLRAHGFMLGHFPQSFEFSTLGGWVAARSSGQQSRHYGRIDQLFAGGEVETPIGTLELPVFPASAAGPDLRQLVLGSEGRMGIITEATVQITPIPACEIFEGLFFPDFAAAIQSLRAIAQADVAVSMLRLSNPTETETNLISSGRRGMVLLEQYLALRRAGDEKCLLIYGLTGTKRACQQNRQQVLDIARQYGGVLPMNLLGRAWRKNRFRGAYLRNSLWDAGYAVDTLETATTWAQVQPMVNGIEQSLHEASASFDEKMHVFTHLSHIYRMGASVYTTYLFRPAATPEETYQRWKTMKTAASQVIVDHGGTISHQHGVGLDHRPYLCEEKSTPGLQALDAVFTTFDPDQMMNPGKLLALEEVHHGTE